MSQTLEHEPVEGQQPHPGLPPQRRGPLGWSLRRRLIAAGVAVAVLAGLGAGTAVVLYQRAVAAEEQRAAEAAAQAARAKAEAAERARLAVLSRAVSTCGLFGTRGVDLGDGDRSLMIDTESFDESLDRVFADNGVAAGPNLQDLGCVLGELNVPDATLANMNATRALDGRQQDTWDDIEASWSFHPDSGFNVVLTVA